MEFLQALGVQLYVKKIQSRKICYRFCDFFEMAFIYNTASCL